MKKHGKEVQLIELSVALADDRPQANLAAYGTPAALHGFRVRAIPFADETNRGPDRFAVCEFPAPIEKGRHGTYLINENNVVRKKILGHARGVEVHPTDAELQAQQWEILD